MRASSFLSMLAVAAVVAAGAETAGAQTAGAQTAAQGGPSASATAPVTTHWSQHPTGKYRLQLALPDHVMDADLTIADSSGTPVANLWPVGDNDGHSLAVAVKDTTLVLSAATPRGPFEMVLQRHGDKLAGHYSMGVQEAGEVQGQVKEEAKTP